jgi:hypothetical protein
MSADEEDATNFEVSPYNISASSGHFGKLILFCAHENQLNEMPQSFSEGLVSVVCLNYTHFTYYSTFWMRTYGALYNLYT